MLTPDEAGQLQTSRRLPDAKDEEEQARELAKDLGYHALALDVTASALQPSVAAEPIEIFENRAAFPKERRASFTSMRRKASSTGMSFGAALTPRRTRG